MTPNKPPEGVLTLIKDRVTYNPDTGELSHGSINVYGYVQMAFVLEGIRYTLKGHHVAYFLYHGEWPDTIIDHDDRVRHHNKISNLKPSTSKENRANSESVIKLNGLPQGVSYFSGKYNAYHYIGSKRKSLGAYSNPEDAIKARKDWEQRKTSI